MDHNRLQQVLGRGYGIAAKKIGPVYDVYRPSGAESPLDEDNKLAAMNADFTPHNAAWFSYDKAPDHQTNMFHGLFDTREIEVGDYFVHATHGTYFVAGKASTFPALCIQCQRIVSVSRPVGATALGLNGYGGNVPSTEVAVVTDWPASLLEMGKGRNKQYGDLPGDVGAGAWQLYLPPVSGVILRDSDILVDDLDRRYVLGTCELQSYGWRCKAMQMVT